MQIEQLSYVDSRGDLSLVSNDGTSEYIPKGSGLSAPPGAFSAGPWRNLGFYASDPSSDPTGTVTDLSSPGGVYQDSEERISPSSSGSSSYYSLNPFPSAEDFSVASVQSDNDSQRPYANNETRMGLANLPGSNPNSVNSVELETSSVSLDRSTFPSDSALSSSGSEIASQNSGGSKSKTGPISPTLRRSEGDVSSCRPVSSVEAPSSSSPAPSLRIDTATADDPFTPEKPKLGRFAEHLTYDSREDTRYLASESPQSTYVDSDHALQSQSQISKWDRLRPGRLWSKVKGGTATSRARSKLLSTAQTLKNDTGKLKEWWRHESKQSSSRPTSTKPSKLIQHNGQDDDPGISALKGGVSVSPPSSTTPKSCTGAWNLSSRLKSSRMLGDARSNVSKWWRGRSPIISATGPTRSSPESTFDRDSPVDNVNPTQGVQSGSVGGKESGRSFRFSKGFVEPPRGPIWSKFTSGLSGSTSIFNKIPNPISAWTTTSGRGGASGITKTVDVKFEVGEGLDETVNRSGETARSALFPNSAARQSTFNLNQNPQRQRGVLGANQEETRGSEDNGHNGDREAGTRPSEAETCPQNRRFNPTNSIAEVPKFCYPTYTYTNDPPTHRIVSETSRP